MRLTLGGDWAESALKLHGAGSGEAADVGTSATLLHMGTLAAVVLFVVWCLCGKRRTYARASTDDMS